MDGGAWKAAVHGVAESRIRLSDFTFTFYFHALEKEMATRSSVLAWRIPGTGEPDGLLDVYGVSQSRTRLKRLSSSSSSSSIKLICFQRHIQLLSPFERKDHSAHDFHIFLLIQQFQDGIRVESLLSEFTTSDHPEDE